MKRLFTKTGALGPFITASLLGHLLCGYILEAAGPLHFAPPLAPPPALHVTLSEPHRTPPLACERGVKKGETAPPGPAGAVYGVEKEKTAPSPSPAESAPPPDAVQENLIPTERRENPVAPAKEQARDTAANGVAGVANVSLPIAVDYDKYKGPVRTAAEFLEARREKLTYRISLLKVPLGSAVMEASNGNGEFRVSLRIASSGVASGLYPVDDLVETRMIGGNYLLTRVKQNEGDLHGDFGFTLMLRERKAFWVDRLRNRYDYQPLPDVQVTDALAGFYSLRSRDLETGKEVQLHLFDGSGYFPARVQVLRREQLRLADLRSAATIVIRPELPAVGLFRNNRDMLVWLTDDRNRVPVKLECATPLGRITAELVSSEIAPPLSPR